MSIKDVISAYINSSVNKKNTSFTKLVGKAILAGMMIGMGAAGSSVAAHAVSNVGLARLVAGVVFPVGLMMVIILGAELFTGDCLVAMAVPEKKVSLLQYIRILISVYLGNLLGGTLLSLMVYYSGQFNYSNGLLGAYTIKVAVGKVGLDFDTAIVSGILCNILVCVAVLMAGCAKDVTGKLLVAFFVIMLFVVSGFEHCVANMYYITAGLLAKMNPDYVAVAMKQYELSQVQIDSLNLFGYYVKNLLPVTLGNIMGGTLFLGLPLYYLNRDKKAN